MLRVLATGLLGLGVCALVLACGGCSSDTSTSVSKSDASVHNHEEGHDHDASGPHGGHLIVLGEEEYHAELTHDEASHTVAIYLLDAAAKEVVPSGPSEIILQVFKDGEFADHVMKPSDEEGMFSVVDEPLCDFLLHSAEVKGRIRAEIGGKSYVGILEHAAHAHAGHEGHDHGTEESGHDHEGHDHGEEEGDQDGHAHEH